MIKIGILGCGTVAAGTIKLIQDNGALIAKRLGESIEIAKVMARTPEKAYKLGIPLEKICKTPDEIINDSEIKIVVELMGGTGYAYECVVAALKAGKNVVTANKDLLAKYWDEVHALAEENRVDIAYEAAVAAGTPVIAPIRTTLNANVYKEITAILNGTTNYILTRMKDEGLSYEEVLKDAQRLGYAEADPASDVLGTDAARKTVILACLAFNSRVRLEDVLCEGITEVSGFDISAANALNCSIKLIAHAEDTGNGISLSVRPTFVRNSHPIAAVNGAFNAVCLECGNAGRVTLVGSGAGALPTGSSVVGDIMETARNIRNGNCGRLSGTCFDSKPIADKSRSFGRFAVIIKSAPAEAVRILESAGIRAAETESAGCGAAIITELAFEADVKNAVMTMADAKYMAVLE